MGGLHPERIVMSRNLVVCCDGTWSDADKMKARERTNVWRIYDAVAGVERETKFYIAGVGTKNLVDKFFLGGLFGVGVGAAICKAYGWLAKHYRPGDRIFLFGFSRGAFTARSLAGFIGGRGLNGELAALPDKTFAKAVAREYDLYRAAAKVARPAPKIHFLGVFETVGKLGIPDQDFKGVNRRDKPENYEFHDTRLGPQVTHARQALSIDDARARYMPVLWTEKRKGSDVERPIYDWTGPGGRTVKQLWFSGKHSDVGGGANPGVTDVPQRWMLEEAIAVGLVVRDGYLDSLKNPSRPRKSRAGSRWTSTSVRAACRCWRRRTSGSASTKASCGAGMRSRTTGKPRCRGKPARRSTWRGWKEPFGSARGSGWKAAKPTWPRAKMPWPFAISRATSPTAAIRRSTAPGPSTSNSR